MEINTFLKTNEFRYLPSDSLISVFIRQNKYFKRGLVIRKNQNLSGISIYDKAIYENIMSQTYSDSFKIKETIAKDNFNIKVAIYKNIDSATYIYFEFDKALIDDILYRRDSEEWLDKSIESYIIGGDKFLRTKSRFFATTSRPLINNTKTVSEMIDKRLSGEGIYEDYRGKQVLGVYAPLEIGGLDWYLMAEIDLDEVNTPFIKLWNNTLLILLIIGAGVFILAYILSKKIIIPTLNLTKAAEEMASGKYPAKLEIISFDEIGQLTESFNEMIDTIKKQEFNLEQEKNKRLTASYDAADDERKRIAQDIHDGLGQSLSAVKLQLECMELSDIEKSEKILESLKNSMNDTIQELRNISNDLMPAGLKEFGLINTISALIKHLAEYSSIEFTLIKQITHEHNLSEKESVYLYRIAQESLKNAIAHSSANKIETKIISDNNKLAIQISDDGQGFDANKNSYGNGLHNLKERADIINAKIFIYSQFGQGSEIRIELNKSYD
jgi:signal transduction histidine kinase